jgi:hypothetical protein
MKATTLVFALLALPGLASAATKPVDGNAVAPKNSPATCDALFALSSAAKTCDKNGPSAWLGNAVCKVRVACHKPTLFPPQVYVPNIFSFLPSEARQINNCNGKLRIGNC